MSYSLTWLPKVLRDAGLKVIETDGWQLRGHGDFGKPMGVLCHHTATPGNSNFPSLNVVTRGRPDLRGPLCNLGLARDGTWLVIAAGSAWHAGRADRAPYRGVYHGNLNLIGIEAENRGYAQGPNADPWPEVQLDSYARGCAALLTYMHQPAMQCIGHKEWAPSRKVDPTFDMAAFRDRVAKHMPRPAGTMKGSGVRMMSLFAGPDPDDNHEEGCMCPQIPSAPIDPKWHGDWTLAETPERKTAMLSNFAPGWKTLAFNVAVAVAAAVQAADWATIVPAQYVPAVIPVVAMVNIWLRSLTSTPMMNKKA